MHNQNQHPPLNLGLLLFGLIALGMLVLLAMHPEASRERGRGQRSVYQRQVRQVRSVGE